MRLSVEYYGWLGLLEKIAGRKRERDRGLRSKEMFSGREFGGNVINIVGEFGMSGINSREHYTHPNCRSFSARLSQLLLSRITHFLVCLENEP